MIHNFCTTSPFLSLTKVELVAPLRVKNLSVCMKKNSKEIVSIVLLLLSLTLLLIPYCHHYYYLKSLTFSSLPLFNPLNPKSDKHLISPYNISPESHVKVMRITEIVTREGTF